MVTRMFKRINLLGLDFYVDWLKETGEFISIKEVHSGRIFVYKGLKNEDGKSVEDMFRDAVGNYKPEPQKEEKVKEKEPVKKEKKEEIPEETTVEEENTEVAPAALETEQPKEELNGKKTKGRGRKSKE